MDPDERKELTEQEKEELATALEKYIDEGNDTTSISEEKAEAIAVRMTDIGSVIKEYIEAHPDRYQEFLNGERGEHSQNPTPMIPPKYRMKKK